MNPRDVAPQRWSIDPPAGPYEVVLSVVAKHADMSTQAIAEQLRLATARTFQILECLAEHGLLLHSVTGRWTLTRHGADALEAIRVGR